MFVSVFFRVDASKNSRKWEISEIKKNHKCNVCDKFRSSSQSLRNHLVRIHDAEKKKKRFNCEKCSQTFYFSKQLIQHINEAHDHSIEYKNIQFPSESKFLEWKEQLYARGEAFVYSQKVDGRSRFVCNFSVNTAWKQNKRAGCVTDGTCNCKTEKTFFNNAVSLKSTSNKGIYSWDPFVYR